jgi:hypothetical protein
MDFETPKTKKKKKPVKKIAKATKKSDAKTAANEKFEPESTESKKLWILENDDWQRPTLAIVAKDEDSARKIANDGGIYNPKMTTIESKGAYMLSMGESRPENMEVEMKDTGQDDPKFWMSNDHSRLYPYPPGTTIIADNELEAAKLLQKKLEDLGLPDSDKFSVQEMKKEKLYVISEGTAQFN